MLVILGMHGRTRILITSRVLVFPISLKDIFTKKKKKSLKDMASTRG
jgi:hypothetical protein